MREVFDEYFCELDECCIPLVDNAPPCSECEHLYCQELLDL